MEHLVVLHGISACSNDSISPVSTPASSQPGLDLDSRTLLTSFRQEQPSSVNDDLGTMYPNYHPSKLDHGNQLEEWALEWREVSVGRLQSDIKSRVCKNRTIVILPHKGRVGVHG